MTIPPLVCRLLDPSLLQIQVTGSYTFYTEVTKLQILYPSCGTVCVTVVVVVCVLVVVAVVCVLVVVVAVLSRSKGNWYSAQNINFCNQHNQFAQVYKHNLPAFARLVSEIVQIRKRREARTYVSESHNCALVCARYVSMVVCFCVCVYSCEECYSCSVINEVQVRTSRL